MKSRKRMKSSATLRARRPCVAARERPPQDGGPRLVRERPAPPHLFARALGHALAALVGVGHQTKPPDEIRRERLGESARDLPQSRDEVEILDRRQLVV